MAADRRKVNGEAQGEYILVATECRDRLVAVTRLYLSTDDVNQIWIGSIILF